MPGGAALLVASHRPRPSRHRRPPQALIHEAEWKDVGERRPAHASAVETLDTYSRIWPDSDDWAREAIDTVLGAPGDCLRTCTGR
jgi:hypothetical protein